jgi:ubiquinone/menaquinone biosynthesis C-methylase UbiE
MFETKCHDMYISSTMRKKNCGSFYLPGIFHNIVIEPITSTLKSSVAGAAKKAGCTSILDICSITGGQCNQLDKKGIHAIGLDINAKMLNACPAQWTNLHLMCADASAIPCKDSSFDGVTLTLAIHDKPFRLQNAILDEAIRILGNQGKMIVADFDVPWSLRSSFGYILSLSIEVFSGHFMNGVRFFRRGGLAPLLADKKMRIINQSRINFPPISIITVEKG